MEAANFLGLAEVKLQRGDTAAAVALLNRMALVLEDGFDTLLPAAELLAKSGKTAEAADFIHRRVKAVPWDSEAKVQLARTMPSGAAAREPLLAAAATDNQAPYRLRAEAARMSAPHPLAGTAGTELALLTSRTIAPDAAAKPYQVEARMEAAREASDPEVKLRLWRFLPDLKSVIEMAGTDSALALYGIRDVEFLYVSRISDADLMKSQLWAVRDKFQPRQAGGVPFYLRTDAASKRTVAFAFAKGYLLLATRDDLVAQALELLAGGANPSIASDRWYRDATAAASTQGELRLVMNLDALVASEYFRSYWVQRNASTVRRYWADVADVKRSTGNITESRVFLRKPDTVEPSPADAGGAAVSSLLALVPPEAGLYRAWRAGDPSETAVLIVQKLIAPPAQRWRDWRDAPMAVSPDSRAGSEADLETRIDEQPLPPDAGTSGSVAAIRAMVEKSGGRALLLVQSSAPAGGPFVRLRSVIVLENADVGDWDRDSVRSSLATAAGRLWTTSQLGAGWVSGTSGRHPFERLDGLGALMFAVRGRLLFLGNDLRLLSAVLDQAGTSPANVALTYAAGFRRSREQQNYQRVMAALDFPAPATAPTFFSGNIASLGRVLSSVAEVRVTEEQRGTATLQTVRYQMQRQ